MISCFKYFEHLINGLPGSTRTDYSQWKSKKLALIAVLNKLLK